MLQAIDGALDDWTVSGDAMRWTPERAVEPIDWSAFGTRPPFADDVEYIESRSPRAHAVLTNVTSTVDADGEWTMSATIPDTLDWDWLMTMLAPYRRT